MSYAQFLTSKAITDPATGLREPPEISPMLFDFQRDIVRWALRRGRAAIFADCGLGKTPMQLEWARHIPGRVLILAPLAVSAQTVREATKFGIENVEYSRGGSEAKIVVTNYEMLGYFDPADFAGVVLDESSILKSYDGVFRNRIIEAFAQTPFRLACTATPAPNDHMELGNHAEFIGALTRTEMLSTYFVHDGGETQKWRLKGHAASDFWRWLCSWAVTIRKPSDLGYEDGNFVLPPLEFVEHVVHAEKQLDGYLFPMPAASLQERIASRRDTLVERVTEAIATVAKDNGPWIVWCNLNAESEALANGLIDAEEIRGSDDAADKEARLIGFADGRTRILVTKPSIAGFGLNWQHCANVAFVGLSDSWEQYYQAVRRCWRFGQTKPVKVHVITADIEGAVLANIKRKEADAERMATEMLTHMRT